MTVLTQGNISITIANEAAVSQYINGDYEVHMPTGGGGQITGWTPAPTGTGQAARHGAMWDPVGSPSGYGMPRDGAWVTARQGFDGRIKVVGAVTFTDYDETLNVAGANGANFPISVELAPGEIKSLVIATSRRLSLTTLVSDSATWGSNPVAIDQMMVVTFVGTPSPANSFRPNYSGTTKYCFTRSDYNAALLPGLSPSFTPTNPKGTSSSDFHFDIGSQYFAHDSADQTEYYQTNGERMYFSAIAAEAISQTALAPILNQPAFPRDMGSVVGRLGLYAMCNFGTTGGGANATENKASSLWAHETLCQHGVDNYPIGLYKGPSGGAGYAFRGLLFPIIYAGHFFNHAGMKAIASRSTGVVDYAGYPLSPFSEVHRVKSSTNADSQYRYPRPRADYPNGPPLWGDMPDYPFTTPTRPYYHQYGGNHNLRDPDGRYTAHANARDTDATLAGDYPPYGYSITDPDNANVNLRNRIMENAGAYDEMAYTLVPQVLVTHILGICNLWNNDALIDYIDWLTEDKRLSGYFEQPMSARNSFFDDFNDSTFYQDFYQFGGAGNGWCLKAWREWRPLSTYRGKVRRRFGIKNSTVVVPTSIEAPIVNASRGTNNGKALACSKGKWRDNPTSFSYQWTRDGVDIGGATSATYTISTVGGDTAGVVLRCKTKATNSAGTAAAWVVSSNSVTVT